jgi:hypothetical protein
MQKGVGSEDVSWQYVDAASGNSESDCMRNWSYYSYTGILIKGNISSATTEDSTRKW